jgi:hypothetical protein
VRRAIASLRSRDEAAEKCQGGSPSMRRIVVLEGALLFEGGFTFSNFVADAFAIFMFVLWFWLFVSVVSDLFRRHDLSGWAKVLWVIALILFSYIGIFAYVLTQGRGMAERNQARAQEAQKELRQIVGYSAADEIEKLDRLKAAGSINEQEYARLRAKAIGA